MSEWRTETPDGRELVVLRRGDYWHARCGSSEAASPNLDVALMEAVRADREVVAHEHLAGISLWVRTQAALVEEAFAQHPDPASESHSR